jgi:DNA-binding transcriptional regulator GbsR (MarR family)
MERLHMSRGGASTNMRALVGWRLARRVPRPADRRDYYVSEGDATELFLTVLAERKRREIDPTIAELRHCLRLLPEHESDVRSERFRERVGGLLTLLEDLDAGFDAIQDDLPTLISLLADRELMVHLRDLLPLLAEPAVRAALIAVMMDLKADGAMPTSPDTSGQPRP